MGSVETWLLVTLMTLCPLRVSLDPEVSSEHTGQGLGSGGGGGKGRMTNWGLAGGSGTSTHPSHVVIPTGLGQVRGRVLHVVKTGGLVGAFLGLPYAEPPVNDLRFKPPMQIQSWPGSEDEIFNGTEFGAICYQPGEQKIWDVVYTKSGRGMIRKRKLEQYTMSEDCLTINIYVPLRSNGSLEKGGAGLPVLFFVHGGSYYMNGGRLYPGQVLASTQGLIVVSFNYRLGPLGFLSTGDGAAMGNYGMLDQVMALEFVEQHIADFGGDAGRITLVGNSAGAASVMFHMFSPLSKGKFVAATVQSGCSGAPWAIQLNPKKHAEALATKLRCPTSPTNDMVDCIRNFSPQLIMKHAKLEDGLSLAYATVIDGRYGGKFLPDHPDTLIKSKSFYAVPILTGFTRDEVTIWFTKFGPTTKTKDLRSFVQVDVVSLLENLPTVTQANMAAMIHSVTVQYLYRAGIGENDTLGKTSSVSDFISDVGLKAPCIAEMNLLSKHTSQPIFLYEFVYFSVDDFKMNRQEWIGAYHESELQFLFGEPYLNYSNHLRSYDDKRVADLVMAVWGTFIKTGHPTPPAANFNADANGSKGEYTGELKGSLELKFNWSNYTENNQDFAVLGLKSHSDKYFLTDRMLFWNFFFPIFRDYPFRFDPKGDCGAWESLKQSWVLWALLSSTLLALLALTLLLTFKLRSSLAPKNHPPAILTNSNNLPLMPINNYR